MNDYDDEFVETSEGSGKNKFDARIVYIKLLGRRIDELQVALYNGSFDFQTNCLYNVFLLIRPYVDVEKGDKLFRDLNELTRKINMINNNKYNVDEMQYRFVNSNIIRRLASDILVLSKDLLLPSNNEQSMGMMDSFFKR